MYFLSRNWDELGFSSFEEEISRRAQRGDTKSYLYIVPTGAAARELINWVTELCTGRAIVPPHILSLDEFIGHLSRFVKPEMRVLSDAESAVFIELALKDLLRSHSLEYFESESDSGPRLPIPRGTFELLVAGIAGLKESGISPAKLAQDTAHAESDGQRLIADRSALRRSRDLAAIYSEYEKRLGTDFTDKNGQYANILSHLGLDSDDLSARQATLIETIFAKLFEGVTDIFIGSFIKIHEPARKILFAFSDLQNVRLTFGIDYEKGNPALFAVQERLIEQATSSGFTFIIPKERDSALPAEIIHFQKALRHSLFTTSRSPQRVSARIFSHAAVTMREEIRFAAKKIKELVASREAPDELSKICVCMYRQDEYAPLAREIFREYGIPANITDRARLDRAPLYLAFNALFDIAEFNFNRRSVLRLLASPYLLISDSNGERVDAANLYEVITEYRLRQGSASWVEEIDIHREDLATQEKPSLDEFEFRELQEKAAKLDRARKDIGVIETLVQRLRGNKTPAEFHESMLALIRDTDVLRQLLLSSGLLAKADALEFDTRSYRAFTELLEELLNICSKLGLEKTSLPLTFYTERIRIAALRTRFAPRAEPGRGVVITSFEQTIGYEFEHLFLLGMNDGIFPEIYSPSLFQLREHQSGEDEKLVEQRYLFYQTLSTFRNSAYIVWHSGSDDKKSEILRSQFADALEEIAPFQEIPAAAQEAQIFSSNEFFRFAAKDKDPEKDLALALEHGLNDDALETLRGQIPHSVAVEEKRRQSALSEYSGVFPFDELTDAEQRDLLSYRDRVYSISQLETYAACPFKFFSKYVLHLESGLQKDVEEGLSGAERGVVLHDTLYEILSSLRQSDRDIRSLSDEDFAIVRDEVFARQQKRGNTERVHPFLRLDTESVFSPPEPGIGVLQKFIEAERKYASFITKPSFFEATFGIKAGEDKRDKLLYREEHVEIEGVKFRGKIDRIDMDSESGVFSVIDYKSGKSATPKDIERGISLQLPLYLRIAEDLLRAHLGDETMSGVAGIYHTLLSKESEQKLALGLHDFAGKAFEGHKNGKLLKAEVATAEALQEIIAATIGFAKQYVEGISGGSFPLVKEENISACTYCEYKLVCRVGEALESGSLRK